MKFQTFALGAATAMAITGLLPATALAAGPPTGSAGASAGASSAASVSDKNNINVSVVNQLPQNYRWENNKLYDNGQAVTLPPGYSYYDGGVVGQNDHFFFRPVGARETVMIAPMSCQGGKYTYDKVASGNAFGKLVDSALKACATVYDWAYGLISDTFGSGSAHTDSSSYGSAC